MKIDIRPIGVIYTPYKKLDDVPRQAEALKSSRIARVKVFKKYAVGLKDVSGFSHITLLFYFHKSNDYYLITKPFTGDTLRGVFATRSPHRPNHIGVSIVELVKRRGNILWVRGMDALNGTPLLDIKPYVPVFDERYKRVRIGWLKGKIGNQKKSYLPRRH